MQNERWEYLLRRFYEKSGTPEEREELMEALRNAIPGEPDDLLLDDLMAEHKVDTLLETTEADEMYERIKPKTPVLKMRWWAAAAAVLLIAGSALYFPMPQKQPPVLAAKVDAAPGTNKAILTLADGSQIALDSTGKQVILQGKTNVSQQGGELVYDAKEEQQVPVYNTLTTPKGGQFKITLPDNSTVWLNAASSIRFPTAFVGNERKVEVMGEAYFEVSPDAAKPFKVTLYGGTEIKVLGTHFNVNAYTDEESIQTSLLEGKVEVTKGEEKALLKPGQQANVTKQIAVKDMSAMEKTQVVAWKNGVFYFEQKSLQEVMRQLGRWYNVEVIYKGTIPQRIFGGELSRSLYLSDIVDVMRTMKVNVTIEEGNKLIVMP